MIRLRHRGPLARASRHQLHALHSMAFAGERFYRLLGTDWQTPRVEVPQLLPGMVFGRRLPQMLLVIEARAYNRAHRNFPPERYERAIRQHQAHRAAERAR